MPSWIGSSTYSSGQRLAGQALVESFDNSEAIETAEVLVHIYELKQDDNDLGDAIIIATNSQTPVETRDLKANEPKQKALAQSISLLGYTYRTKRED